MECLQNTVGISKMDCICLTDGLTPEQIEAAKKSTSGLYLDTSLSGGIKLADVKYLDMCGEYFRLAKESIEAAERDFYDDITVSLLSKYKAIKPKFIGEIGRLQYAGFINIDAPLQYVRIEPIDGGGGILQIDTLRLNINASKAVNIKIVAVFDGLTYGTTVYETTVNSISNRWVDVPMNDIITLPLLINGKKMIYYVVWEKTGTENAVDNSTSCGCSGGDGYSSFISVTGGAASDYNNLVKNEGDKFAKGLSIGAQLYCDSSGIVCDLYNTNDMFKLVAPKAILFKAGANLINNVLKSSEISRLTMMNRETMWGTRNNFIKEYENRVSYLGIEIDMPVNGCFSCSNNNMWVGNIYS